MTGDDPNYIFKKMDK